MTQPDTWFHFHLNQKGYILYLQRTTIKLFNMRLSKIDPSFLQNAQVGVLALSNQLARASEQFVPKLS